MRLIKLNSLWKCDTCFYMQNGTCTIRGECDRGEEYHPAYNKLKTIETNVCGKWIPVTERLPEENHDGSVNAVLVTDGFVQHMAYFARGEWRFAESGEMKEPMWYSITHWMPLPKPPKDGGAE